MRQGTETYIPILKSKATSFRALKLLKRNTKGAIIPFLEVAPDTEQNLVTYIKTHWDGLPCYLDFVFLDGDGVGDIISFIAKKCRDEKQNVIIVTGPDRTQEYQEAAIKNSHDFDIALRFSIGSLSTDKADEVIKAFYSYIKKDVSRVHAFLDMEDVRGGSEFYAVRTLLPMIFVPGLANIGLISGAFPDSTDLIDYKNSVTTIPRHDYLLWKAIKSSRIPGSKELCFGDYTIRDTELPFQGFSSHQIPTLRYTLENEFYIHRGISYRKHVRGMNQFNDECKELISKEFFRGPDFSYGDQQIHEKGTVPDSSSGSSGTWAQIGVNQHIEYVVYQLSNPSAS